ncbi:MAG: Ig-like domain-containing protein [Pseudomonadota bacterium]
MGNFCSWAPRALGIVATLGLGLWGQGAAAQSTLTPFSCSGEIYQVQSGQLRIFNPISSSYVNVGTNQGSYNATGFNVLDGYGYASQGSRVIRIGADGQTETVFTGISGSFSGDVDASNNFWLRSNNNAYRRIDLATGAVTTVNFAGPGGGPADVAYIEFGGNAYLIGFSGSQMFRYNITNGTKQAISVTGGQPGGGYGATWTDVTGRLFTFNNNTGEIWEVFDYDTGSPSSVFVAQADPSGNNDGFSCPEGPFPNLPPLAFDDDYTTPVNVAFSDNVITNNDNGIDNDPEGGAITVDPTPITDVSNGTLVLNPDGTFTYTPDANFIGTDSFVYEIADPSGLTAQATVTITITGTIDFSLNKVQVAGPSPVTAAGQTLTYDVVVVNTGDVPLTDVDVEDTPPDGVTFTLTGQAETGGAPNVPGQLDIGETWTYTYSYTVTQDDIDSGANLVNAVSATTDETGSDVKTDAVSASVNQTADYTLVKNVDTSTLNAPGTLTYEIIVTNTGNVTLTGAGLTDTLSQNGTPLALTSGPTLSGDTDGDGEIDVGQVWTYAATLEASQSEIDAGTDIINTADFTTAEAGDETASAVTAVNTAPAMTVSKSRDVATLNAPGLITYAITVSNDGNVTLTGVTVTDLLSQGGNPRTLTSGPALSGDLDGDGEIDVGETWSFTATYQATQADIDDGADLVNEVTVASNELPDDAATVSTTIAQTASFSFAKSVDQTDIDATGSLRFEIPVVNTGNVTLTGITFTDVIAQSGNGSLPAATTVLSGDVDNDGELDVGESWLYVITQPVDQAMIDNGNPISNVASFDPAEAGPQNGSTLTTISQTDALGLTKAVATGAPTSFDEVGDQIDFTFTVTNTGNTTRPGPILINDDQIGNGLLCQTGDLAPGVTISCDHTWTADQGDLDNPLGAVTNTAQALDNDGITSADATATVTSIQMPEVTLLKELAPPLPNFQPGETLNYTFTVANTGNVTLTSPVTVTDSLLTNVSCGPVPGGGLAPSGETRAAVLAGTATLGPANSLTCSGSHVITIADVDVGSITNVASVDATFNGDTVTHQNDAIFPVDAEPALVLEKLTVPDPASFAALNDVITYSYAVTNQQPVGGIGVAITQPVFVDDDKLAGPFLCYDPGAPGNGPINVGQTVTCTATYTVTQADLDAEEITNTATANTTYTAGDGSVAQVISPPDSVTITADLTPAIALAKSVDPGVPTPTLAGQTIPYTIVATNTGQQTLSNVAISDPQLGALSCSAPAPVTLLPTEAVTCTGSYTVSQGDIDSQTVGDASTARFTNTATVAANDPFGVPLTPVTDSATQPLDPAAPALSILKELLPDPLADPAYSDVGDILSFRMTVTNTGNTTVNGITVTDSLVAGTCAIGTLAPSEVDQTCLFDYVVTQADIDAGSVENTGSVTGQPSNPGSDPLTETDDFVAPGPAKVAQLTVLKDGTLDLGPDGVAGVGDVITYQITVTNSGNVTVSDIAVTDPTIAPLTYAAADDGDGDGDIDTLLPNASAVVTGTYTLDQEDIDAGTVTNSATASGTDPDGGDVEDTSDSTDANDGTGDDDPTVTDLPRGPGLSVLKTVSEDTDVDVGTVLTYSYVVENTGNVTLTDVTLVDQHTSATGVAALSISPNGGVVPELSPGASQTFTSTYTVTQEDIDSGVDLTNTVIATSTSPPGTTAPTASDDEDVDLEDRAPGISVDKSVSQDMDVTVGTVLTYSYEVENTGNVTLTDVTLDDQHISASGTAPLAISPNGGVIATLAPGASQVFTATYTVTQDDIDAGTDLTNTVVVTTMSPSGTTPPTDADTEAVDLAESAPSLEVLKTVDSVAGSMAGDAVVFEITVENTGNVTLTAPMLTDTLRQADGTPITPAPSPVWNTLDAGTAGALDVGETWTYSVSYVLTQADIDAGGITNTVLAEAQAPDGSPVSDVSDNGTGDGNDPTAVLIPAAPSIETVKTITSTTTEVGGTVRFDITVENTGNVTLSSVAVVSDTLTRNDPAATPLTLTSGPTFTGASLGSGAGTLQVGEVATYRVTYVLTQDDIDAGGIANTATASGTPPMGIAPVTDVSDDDGPGDDPTVLTITAAPEILFDKRLAAGSGPSFDAPGDVLSFEFEITNIGNVTLSPPYAVSDPLIDGQGGAVSCPAADIVPNAAITCTGTYTTTQADVDAGGITNVATATVGDADPVTATEPVPAVQTPALDLAKVAQSIAPEDFVSGLVVTYTFTATNTGNTTLTDPITIDDALFSPGDYVCDPFPAGGLAPGAAYVCTADYTITPDDVALAVVVNNATATSGPVDSPIATETIPNNGTPALTIEKALIRANDPDGSDSGTLSFDEVGDQLVYEFTVTNTGDVAFARDVEVFDTLFAAPISCFVPSAADPELASGEMASCQGVYTVTQDDLDAGDVLNEAFARTEFGAIPTIVLSEPDDLTTPATLAPGFSIEKTVNAPSFATVGDVLTYDITVTNTGNQTLTNVMVDDPLLPTLTCEAATLAVGGVLSCSGTYTVDQADIDAGGVTNMATATGLDPFGDPVAPQTDTVTSDGPVGTPTISLEKVGSPDPFGAVGSDVTFVFRVTNTGIFTVSGIVVTDPILGGTFTCAVGTLSPGEVSEDCSVAVVVTQEDVDAGEIVNTATAEGMGPDGAPVTTSDSVTVAGPPASPAIELTKTALVPATTVGSTVTFTFTAENTGNVSLAGVDIADELERNDGSVLDLTTPVTLETSGGIATGDADGDGLLDPGEVWTYSATYQITQDDVNAGGVSNTATVFASPPGGGNVFDVSDDGNDGDGNDSDDPTDIIIDTNPVLDVEKVITQSTMTVGETVIYEIRAANRGNVDIINVTASDMLTRSDGTDLSSDISGPTRVGSPSDNGDTTLDPGEVWVWEVSYTLTQADIDAGSIANVGQVDATEVGGDPVVDVSDNGDDSDGNITDDPTVLSFVPDPSLDVIKVTDFVGVQQGEDVVFTITALNTGNVTLSSVMLTDTMTNGNGDALSPVDIVASGLSAAGELLPGETATYTVTYVMTQADIDSGSITNTASVDAVAPSGGPVSDISDDGLGGPDDTGRDPTIAPIVQTPSAEANKSADVPTRLSADIFEVTFTMTATNSGNVTLTNLSLTDDLSSFLAPAATLVGVDAPVVSGFDVGTANAGYDGISDIDLLESGAQLAPGSTGTVSLTVRYDAGAGAPQGQNVVTLGSDELPAAVSASTPVITSEDPDILATKSATPEIVRLGDTITYSLSFTNLLNTIESAVSFVDTLPAGIVYTPGSAIVTGGPANEPVSSGPTLTWGPVNLAPGQTVTVVYQARLVDGPPGDYVNSAIALGPDGQELSNLATATVTRQPEAVFDCTDIIGKVFDDRNLNGYQDVPSEDRGITDQTYGEKFDAIEEPEFEPGLPNVRLATPNGTLITTDEFGRYSVPCAALPADIGSNFFLKLDTRTLPTGYVVTTENPRVIRVTPGTMSRLNFGAALGNLIELDLMAAAFEPGGTTPTPALSGYVDQIVAQIDDLPSVLRLTYYRAGEDRRAANARLDALEALIRDRWRRQGSYRLTIERIVRRTQ